MNVDSGLSLTTARDATEVDSDHETNVNKEISTDNVKQLRPLLTKKDKDDTDSDEVFVEVLKIDFQISLITLKVDVSE
jgi:hypothetical protein